MAKPLAVQHQPMKTQLTATDIPFLIITLVARWLANGSQNVDAVNAAIKEILIPEATRSPDDDWPNRSQHQHRHDTSKDEGCELKEFVATTNALIKESYNS